MEIGGESQLGSLIPYNVDSQDVRQRFWDGHDYFLSDSMNLLKGNHLFQFGGTYSRNYDYHGRDDNGVGMPGFEVELDVAAVGDFLAALDGVLVAGE